MRAIEYFYYRGDFSCGRQLQEDSTPSILKCINLADSCFWMRWQALSTITRMASFGGTYIEFMYTSGTLNTIVQILHQQPDCQSQSRGLLVNALAVVLQCVETKVGANRFFLQYPSAFMCLMELVRSRNFSPFAPSRAVRALLMFPEPFMDGYGTGIWMALAKALSDSPIEFDMTLTR